MEPGELDEQNATALQIVVNTLQELQLTDDNDSDDSGKTKTEEE